MPSGTGFPHSLRYAITAFTNLSSRSVTGSRSRYGLTFGASVMIGSGRKRPRDRAHAGLAGHLSRQSDRPHHGRIAADCVPAPAYRPGRPGCRGVGESLVFLRHGQRVLGTFNRDRACAAAFHFPARFAEWPALIDVKAVVLAAPRW